MSSDMELEKLVEHKTDFEFLDIFLESRSLCGRAVAA